eukprot:gene37051-45701_t
MYSNIVFWSYNEALEAYPTTKEVLEKYPYIEWLPVSMKPKTIPRKNFHPPWFTHLFIADLIAATMGLVTSTHDEIPTNSSAGVRCDSKTPPLLHITYNHILNNKPMIGSFSSPKDAWKVMADLKGRGGFIRQLNNESTLMKDNNGTLTFVGSSTTGIARNESLRLSVLHLKSYNHAGLVDVFVCGQKVGSMDALWSNHDTFK